MPTPSSTSDRYRTTATCQALKTESRKSSRYGARVARESPHAVPMSETNTPNNPRGHSAAAPIDAAYRAAGGSVEQSAGESSRPTCSRRDPSPSSSPNPTPINRSGPEIKWLRGSVPAAVVPLLYRPPSPTVPTWPREHKSESMSTVMFAYTVRHPAM